MREEENDKITNALENKEFTNVSEFKSQPYIKDFNLTLPTSVSDHFRSHCQTKSLCQNIHSFPLPSLKFRSCTAPLK